MEIYLEYARPEHAALVADDPAPGEQEEWEALRPLHGHGSPEESLRYGIRHSAESWYACDALGPVGLFGVMSGQILRPVLGRPAGVPWLRAASGILRHKTAAVRLARCFLRRWSGCFDRLDNAAGAPAQRFLRACGIRDFAEFDVGGNRLLLFTVIAGKHQGGV